MRLSLLFLLSFAAIFGCCCASSQNITKILAGFPSYSTLNSLLSKYGVASQINSRTTITVLCPPNSVLDPVISSLGSNPDRQTIYDILSYHVLLDYFDSTKLKEITNGTTLSTTLFQTTGMAIGNGGFVNITDVKGTPHVGVPTPGVPLKAIIGKVLFKAPYNISCLAINSVLIPEGVGTAPSPAPAPVNITLVISQAGNFSIFLGLINETGVDAILQNNIVPPGETIFVPTNAAFDALPKGTLDKLSTAQKVAILEFHALNSYYTLQELGTLTGVVTTLASGPGGDTYTVKISQSKSGSVAINTGKNIVPVGGTIYSGTPVSIFIIDSVLLPTDIFGVAPVSAPAPTPVPVPAPSSPSSAPSPAPASTPTPTTSPSSPPSATPFSSPPAPPPGAPGASTSPSASSPETSTNHVPSKMNFVHHAWLLAFVSVAAVIVI